MIKVSGLIHKREKQIYPRLVWFMFQNIYIVYHYINNKEEKNDAMLLTNSSEQE